MKPKFHEGQRVEVRVSWSNDWQTATIMQVDMLRMSYFVSVDRQPAGAELWIVEDDDAIRAAA